MKNRFVALYLAGWSSFLVLYAAMIATTPGSSFLESLSASFFTVVPAAAMGLLVWRAAARPAWPPQNRTTFVLTHTVFAILYATVWSGITLAQIAVFAPREVMQVFIQRALGWQALMGLLLYVVIAGIAYVVQVTERLTEQRMLASRAELQALRAQLNPHFLFNTLHSIGSLARRSGAETEQALDRFGSLLRYVLDSSRRTGEDATLEEELAFAKGYLEIEKMRLGDRLNVSEDVDPEALECVIPVLTLQPIVENAVQHGIAPRASGGNIFIGARMIDGGVAITVRDDGVGADVGEVATSNGYGLDLVKRRLALRFGESAHVEVDSSKGSGMTVTVSVPS